jgi:hypothetical protein
MNFIVFVAYANVWLIYPHNRPECPTHIFPAGVAVGAA